MARKRRRCGRWRGLEVARGRGLVKVKGRVGDHGIMRNPSRPQTLIKAPNSQARRQQERVCETSADREGGRGKAPGDRDTVYG